MLISVVIAAHDRPELLREAVASVAEQTYGQYEVVVVDDGSSPPLESAPLELLVGDRLVFLRHEMARGISGAKNAGIGAAHGEIVLLLDDDDLLFPHALQTIQAAFAGHPGLNCLFMGVEPFGPYAEGPSRNRCKALERLFERAQPKELDGLLFFSEHLFGELIGRVPIDFQRPAARRSAWDMVGGLDERALFAEPSWAVRAAAVCTVALTVSTLTRWRIHGRNFGWPPGLTAIEVATRNLRNSLLMAEGLERAFRSGGDERSRRRHRLIVKHLAAQHLAMARHLRVERVGAGFSHLARALRLDASAVNLRAAFAYLFPPGWLASIRRLRGKGASSATGA